MKARTNTSCLFVVLVLMAGAAAAQFEGRTDSLLTSMWPSFLGVDLGELETIACGIASPGRGAVLLITQDGGGATRASLSVEVLNTVPSEPAGTLLASVQPISLRLAAAVPLVLRCGSFAVQLRLDPGEIQPVSQLLLVPNSREATSGTCAGVLEMKTLLMLVPVSGGATIEVPRTLKLRMSGQWTMIEKVGTGADSALLFFASSDNGGIVPQPSCLGDEDPATTLCFEGFVLPPQPR